MITVECTLPNGIFLINLNPDSVVKFGSNTVDSTIWTAAQSNPVIAALIAAGVLSGS